jgi:hypothetical protein
MPGQGSTRCAAPVTTLKYFVLEVFLPLTTEVELVNLKQLSMPCIDVRTGQVRCNDRQLLNNLADAIG